MKLILPSMLGAVLSLSFSPVFAQDEVIIHAFKQVAAVPAFLKGKASIQVSQYKVFEIDYDLLRNELEKLNQSSSLTSQAIYWLELPSPDGTMALYSVKENGTMSKGLAAKYPQIKAYDGFGKNGEFVKFEVNPKGFHAMIIKPSKSTTFIDPYIRDENNYYIVYDRKDRRGKKSFNCSVPTPKNQSANLSPISKKTRLGSTPFTNTCQLRQYRLALAATYQYTQFFGGTVADALAAQVTSVNRVNGIYQLEAGITLQLITDNDKVICDYLNCPTSPPGPAGVQTYTSGVANPNLISQSQNNIPLFINPADFDIGHVVDYNANSYASDGVASLGGVCTNSAKASAATSSPQPFSDSFDVDFFAHEIGHQFGGTHTQSMPNCEQTLSTAVEPGSGSTIIAYAGICAPNVQGVSDPYFNNSTLQQFGNFVTGDGNCSTNVPIPQAPTISTVASTQTLPINTPFALTASATTTAPGAVLTYGWEESDVPTSNPQPPQPPLSTNTNGPNYRSFTPTTSSTRYFPNLSDLANSAASGVQPTWEVFPSINRTLTFAVTVRNNTAGGSCNAYVSGFTLNTTGTAGSSFAVTVPNNPGIYWQVGTDQEITWNVAGTASITPTVNILLSTDGGLSYPTIIASGVDNDGEYEWTVPNITTANARIMVIAASNTYSAFFNISGHNFAIANPTLTKAVRNPLKSSSAFIYFTSIPPEWFSGSFQLNGYPNASVDIDADNNRFIVSNLSSAQRINASLGITIGGIVANTNTITIPGVLG